jgi:cell division protein FtsB
MGQASNLKHLYWVLGSILLVSLFIIFFVLGDYGLYHIYELKQEKKALEAQMVQLRIEYDSLKAEKQRLEVDLDYIEQIAREKYRMAKEGEKVFRIIEKEAP